MKTQLMAMAAAAFVLVASAAQSSITINTFDPLTYNPGFGAAPNVGEDFETLGANGGEREVGFIGTPFDTMSVGTFVTLGGTGSGGTVTDPTWDNTGKGLALREGNVYGRENTTPDTGNWFLDSNDTHGILWEASLAGGKAFDRISFTLSDAADQGAFVKVTTGTDVATLVSQSPSSVKLVEIVFGTAVTSATIELLNYVSATSTTLRTNDGLSIDGVQISAVPVPAALSFALLGLAGAGAYRARQQRRRAA